MGIKNKKKIKKEYIPVIIAVILFIGLIVALIAVLLYKPKEATAEIDPNQHVQEEIVIDNSKSSCKKETLNELYKLASKITVDTKILEDKMPGVNPNDDTEAEITYFTPELNFSNVDDKLYLNITRDCDDLNQNVNPTDGKAVFKSEWADTLVTYTIEVKSNGDCKDETVRKFTVVTPIYNYLSGYSLCLQIPKFNWCQKFVMEAPPSFTEFRELADQYMNKNNITTTNKYSFDVDPKDITTMKKE